MIFALVLFPYFLKISMYMIFVHKISIAKKKIALNIIFNHSHPISFQIFPPSVAVITLRLGLEREKDKQEKLEIC